MTLSEKKINKVKNKETIVFQQGQSLRKQYSPIMSFKEKSLNILIFCAYADMHVSERFFGV